VVSVGLHKVAGGVAALDEENKVGRLGIGGNRVGAEPIEAGVPPQSVEVVVGIRRDRRVRRRVRDGGAEVNRSHKERRERGPGDAVVPAVYVTVRCREEAIVTARGRRSG
jgi:hypothetical protein